MLSFTQTLIVTFCAYLLISSNFVRALPLDVSIPSPKIQPATLVNILKDKSSSQVSNFINFVRSYSAQNMASGMENRRASVEGVHGITAGDFGGRKVFKRSDIQDDFDHNLKKSFHDSLAEALERLDDSLFGMLEKAKLEEEFEAVLQGIVQSALKKSFEQSTDSFADLFDDWKPVPTPLESPETPNKSQAAESEGSIMKKVKLQKREATDSEARCLDQCDADAISQLASTLMQVKDALSYLFDTPAPSNPESRLGDSVTFSMASPTIEL